ncbi:MAG: glutamyl-tRNA reductase [Nocardioides sp.]
MTSPGGAGLLTGLGCISVSGCRVSLPMMEALSFRRDECHQTLLDLQRRSGATALCVLSTCERIELYATWTQEADLESLMAALAANRGLPYDVVSDAATGLIGRAAVRHLFRVTAGLESFVLGESDIVGQVRAAAEASRSSGAGGLELDRLLDTAVNTSRRVHRNTGFGESGRSVASSAVRMAATDCGGHLEGRRVLVVGAGHAATDVAQTAVALGAAVTVCNRTRRHADRFAAAGAEVVDLARVLDVLSTADVAIFATAAPHRLVEAAHLAAARSGREKPLLLVDLCVPRNVDPAVGGLADVRLVDLGDLRLEALAEGEVLTRDVARAEQIVGEELGRYLRWMARRCAAVSVQRFRADVEACAQRHVEQVTRGVPADVRQLVETGVLRAVRQLAHGPTLRMLEAAEAGDDELVLKLAGIFAPSAQEG